MTKNHSTSSLCPRKPHKSAMPHKDLTLYAYATKQWAKKIKRKVFYRGP
jgi:hypothetical protein